MRIKHLLVPLAVLVFVAGMTLAYPGAPSKPDKGADLREKIHRSNDPDANSTQPDHPGDYRFSVSDDYPPKGDDDPNTAVPEPGTLILMGLGLAGGAWLRHKRKI